MVSAHQIKVMFLQVTMHRPSLFVVGASFSQGTRTADRGARPVADHRAVYGFALRTQQLTIGTHVDVVLLIVAELGLAEKLGAMGEVYDRHIRSDADVFDSLYVL